MRRIITAAMLAALVPGAALAQANYPSGPVTIIVPYGTGGSTDNTARALAIELEAIWGQPVLVVNRPGAGSMIGTTELANSAPDGLTLLINTAAITTAPTLQGNLQYDPETGVTPISLLITSPYVLVAGAAVQSRDFASFLEEAQATPMFMATAGPGSSSHFMSELVIAAANMPADVVHFSGAGEAFTNLMGGHAHTYISTTQSVMPYVNDGRATALAVLANERFPLLPDVQASGELGITGVDIDGWVALFGPGGMDRDLVTRIHADMARAMASDRMQAQLTANFAVAGSLSAAEFQSLYIRDLTVWRELAAERGIGQ